MSFLFDSELMNYDKTNVGEAASASHVEPMIFAVHDNDVESFMK